MRVRNRVYPHPILKEENKMNQKLFKEKPAKPNFFNQVKGFRLDSEKTMALIIEVMPLRPRSKSSVKINRKVDKLAEKRKIPVVKSRWIAFVKLREMGIIEIDYGHHYKLTEKGSQISFVHDKIIDLFLPKPKLLSEQSEQKAVESSLNQRSRDRLKNQEVLIKKQEDSIKNQEGLIRSLRSTIVSLEKRENFDRNVGNIYKKLAMFMREEFKCTNENGSFGKQAMDILIKQRSQLTTIRNVVKQ